MGLVAKQNSDFWVFWDTLLRRGNWRRRGEQSMASDKEKMAEAGEVEKEKRRIHQCSSVLRAGLD